MTQKAAASLSSSLFARKGKASPASLLISEMEAANSAGKAAVNGSTRRRPKAEADLPLLAYVEAQSENESENDNESGEDLAAAAEIGAETAGEAAEAPRAAQAEPPPAASLLDRGAKPLRRPNGRKPAPSKQQDDDTPPVVQADRRDAARPDDTRPDDTGPEETMEAETVSGDANVAAIEDASDEDIVAEAEAPTAKTVTVEAEADTVEADDAPMIVEAAEATPPAGATAEAAAVVIPPAAENPGAGHKAETGPAEGTAPRAAAKSASQEKAAAAIAASVALRHAKTLNMEPTLRAPSADKSQVVPPRPRVAGQPSRSHLWRGAAVVVLGAALGFGAYMVFAGKPAEPPAPIAAALPDATAEPAAAPAPESASAAPPAQEAAATESAATESAAAAEPVLPEPSFDIIRIEPDGQSIIAGRAEPFSEWILLNNGTPIASVRADVNGEWVVLPDASLVPGANAFSLVPKTERGKVAIPAPDAAAPQSAPANGAPANEAQVPADPPSNIRGDSQGTPEAVEGAVQNTAPPTLESATEFAGLLLPKRKPTPVPMAGGTSAQPASIQVSADGAYEVQLASVRQTEDAARERDRLAAAFPHLLGDLDLRVQQAAVDGAGIFYRVRSGAIADLGLARDICRQLEAGGQGCLVVRRAAEAPAPEPVTELVEDVPAEPAVSAAGQQAERPQ